MVQGHPGEAPIVLHLSNMFQRCIIETSKDQAERVEIISAMAIFQSEEENQYQVEVLFLEFPATHWQEILAFVARMCRALIAC